MIIVDTPPCSPSFSTNPKSEVSKPYCRAASVCVISAVNAHETACVLRLRHNQAMVDDLWRLLADNEIEIVPFDEVQVRAAAVAIDLYGRGDARLNLCDCAAYALAKTMNSPLLFKGNDFTHTDVKACF